MFQFCADYFSDEMKISLGLKKKKLCKYEIILYVSALGIVLSFRGVFNIPVKIHRYFLDFIVNQLCEKTCIWALLSHVVIENDCQICHYSQTFSLKEIITTGMTKAIPSNISD